MPRLVTKTIRESLEIALHFDNVAPAYAEQHGDPDRLLEYRLTVLDELHAFRGHRLLEIGCGPAQHGLALLDGYNELIGTDVSEQMVELAQANASGYIANGAGACSFHVDPAEKLGCVDDASVDTVLCVGAFEHMYDPQLVLHQVHRVLVPGGHFVCMTPNGAYCWYTSIAPKLGIETRHLSTDRFRTLENFRHLALVAKLDFVEHRYWTFIPKGDMGLGMSSLLGGLDLVGRIGMQSSLRGGLAFKLTKPQN